MLQPDISYFIEEPPEFELRGGLFHITQKIGDQTFERVMRPSVFMVALRRAAEAARKHRFASAEIVEFAKREEARTG
jgi:hypothetical protein